MTTKDDLTAGVLSALRDSDSIVTADAFPQVKTTDVKAVLDRLGSRSMITYETLERDEFLLEAEGEQIAANGSHEARVFEALRQAVAGLSVADLEKAVGDKQATKLGQGKAFREKWIAKTSDGKFKAVVSAGGAEQRQN